MRFSGTDHNWICLGVRTTLNVAHPRYTLPQSQRREWGAPSLGPLPVYERETLASNANDDDVDYFLHLCVSQQCDSTRLLAARNAHPIFPYKANADIAISGFHLPHSSIVINQCLITYKAEVVTLNSSWITPARPDIQRKSAVAKGYQALPASRLHLVNPQKADLLVSALSPLTPAISHSSEVSAYSVVISFPSIAA